jgi:hypothetical protein
MAQKEYSSSPGGSSVPVLPPINNTTSTALTTCDLPEMIKADKDTFGQLYTGSTREARMRYLRTRHRRRPESRFTFPLVSSWEYGWRLGDVIKTEDLHNPAHGRSRIIADTFYRNNGWEASELDY